MLGAAQVTWTMARAKADPATNLLYVRTHQFAVYEPPTSSNPTVAEGQDVVGEYAALLQAVFHAGCLAS